jgi:hypothetical protein
MSNPATGLVVETPALPIGGIALAFGAVLGAC